MIFTKKNTKEIIKILHLPETSTMEAVHKEYERITSIPEELITATEIVRKEAVLKIVNEYGIKNDGRKVSNISMRKSIQEGMI